VGVVEKGGRRQEVEGCKVEGISVIIRLDIVRVCCNLCESHARQRFPAFFKKKKCKEIGLATQVCK